MLKKPTTHIGMALVIAEGLESVPSFQTGIRELSPQGPRYWT